MINQLEFNNIIREIVATEFPNELMSFQLGGTRTIQQVYSNQGHIIPSQGTRQFQFISEATVVLNFVQLIAATFLSLKKMYDAANASMEQNPPDALSEEWQKQLVDAGISQAKAISIVSNFSKDLHQHLNQSPKSENAE